MAKKKENIEPVIKTFEAQVICSCSRKCADHFDVLVLEDIFEKLVGTNKIFTIHCETRSCER